ncbi:MAG: ATP synthase F0 subunit C [Firmicutes bacterium]|nr:ATP synthase F0 subunit C [Bacillota bacterium]
MLIATNESESAESAESAEAKVTSTKAISAGVAIAVVAAVGALSMALSISKSAEAIARQPEAAGQVRTSLMLGLVFIETAIIYALIVAILIVFVL